MTMTTEDEAGAYDEETDSASLRKYARIFQVHPRTILRHLKGEGNPTWHRALNPQIKVIDVAKGLDIPPGIIRNLLKRQDTILNAREAAATLDMPLQGFKHRYYKAIIRGHKFTRWLRSQLISEHVLRNM